MISWAKVLKHLPTLLVVGALVWVVVWVMSLRSTVDALTAENSSLTLALAGCAAKALNQTEDRKSDNAVDNMPDLLDVPPGWLLPETGFGRGIY